MKSGTTSLHGYLNSHADIFMCDPKEPGHFGRWLDPSIDRFNRYKARQEYLDMFASARNSTYRGDASTCYSKLPNYVEAAKSIAEFEPNARIVYLMRDPVERLISHYWHMVNNGVEDRSLMQAVTDALDDPDHEDPQYLSISRYAQQLTAYLDCFEREQLLTLTSEALKADTLGTVNEIFKWLRLAPMNSPADFSEKAHVTPKIINPRLRSHWARRFSETRLWKRLRPLTPETIRRLGRAAYHGMPIRTSVGAIDRSAVSLDEVIALLRPVMIPEIEQLSEMLNRKFPEWTTLYGENQGLGY